MQSDPQTVDLSAPDLVLIDLGGRAPWCRNPNVVRYWVVHRKGVTQ
jgi:hypothetical protein